MKFELIVSIRMRSLLPMTSAFSLKIRVIHYRNEIFDTLAIAIQSDPYFIFSRSYKVLDPP